MVDAMALNDSLSQQSAAKLDKRIQDAQSPKPQEDDSVEPGDKEMKETKEELGVKLQKDKQAVEARTQQKLMDGATTVTQA